MLNGIAIGGYRSFRETQRIVLNPKLTLMAGPNNAGKSNVMGFLRTVLPKFLDGHGTNRDLSWESLDLHMGHDESLICGIGFDPQVVEPIKERAKEQGGRATAHLEAVLGCLISQEDGLLWLDMMWRPSAPKIEPSPRQVADIASLEEASRGVSQALLSSTSSSPQQNATEIIRKLLAPRSIGWKLPNVEFIPAFREVGHRDPNKVWAGADIVKRLASLQHPPLENYEDKRRFRRLNSLLANVTDDEDAAIEIPVGQDTILVHLDGRVLPLEFLGTGIHEVVILGAAATVTQDSIMCIEEPEIHLHPILQRKLLSYLATNTDNQYVIATHSAHLLDAPDASVVAVRLEDGATRLAKASQPNDRWLICHDLGYRASDIVQSNYIVWVEGPSDRIYLRHWIESFDSNLVEGIHYSIMFYGGRLLAHLSPTDPEVEEFISLRRLNRNIAVVVDSDKANKKATLNDTKQRVLDALTETNGVGWATQGREIENYIERGLLESAILEQDREPPTRMGQFSKVYPTGTDKIRLARNVASNPAHLDVLDLEQRIHELVEAIRTANT